MQYAQTFPSHYGMSIAVICSAPTASCVAKQTIQKIYHVNPTTDVADIHNSLLHCTNTKRLTKGSQSSWSHLTNKQSELLGLLLLT